MDDSSPGSKRAVSDVEGGDDYHDDEQQAPANKRHRALNNHDDEEDYEEEEENVKAEEIDPADEEVDAEVLEEEEEADGDDDEETSTSQVRKQINAPGRPPEAGIILKVYVENFMCHRRFEVNLCRNVNFITGQNGSGKSAILAAIQICLGAGARKTHRARNLKDLVRKDATTNSPTHARIQVKLLNGGEDAFKPEIYGETITVERTITLGSGFNGYKLLDENGAEKSRSKKDLEAMLDQLNIQVENPVAVLDQEEAKKFLTGKSEDKYKFFMKATELARVSNTFAGTLDNIQELDDAKNKMAASLDTKKQQVRELKKRYEEHRALDKLQEQLMEAQVNYSWALYQNADQTLVVEAEKLQQYQEKTAKKEDELAALEKSYGNPDDEEEERKNKLEELNDEAAKQADTKTTLEAELRELVRPKKQLERQHNSLRKERKNKERALKVAKQRLQEARDEILEKAGSAESELAQRTALLKELEEKLAECKGKKDELKQEVGTNFRKFQETEPHAKDAAGLVSNAQQQIRAMEGKLESLEASSSDALAVFGAKVRHVHRLVENAKKGQKFHGPVVGPIGSHVTIVPGKEEFAAVAEHALGGMKTLDRFIVTNDADRVLLQSMRNQAKCQGECAIFQINDRSRIKIPSPPEGVETVATVLKIDHALVFNALVDFSKIDTRAVCRDKDSSERQLLYKDEKGEDAIRGVIKEVFLLPDGTSWMVKSGARAVFSNHGRKLRKTIGTDKTAAVADLKADLEEKLKEIGPLRQDENRLAHECLTFQKNWNTAKKAMQQNGKEIDNLTVEIETTRAELEESSENVAIDTSELEQDVTTAEEELEGLETKETRLVKEIEDCNPEIEAKEALIEECRARNQKVIQDIDAASEELTQLLESKTQRENQLEKKRQKLAKYHAAVEEVQSRVDTAEADKTKFLQSARKMTHSLQMQKEFNATSPEESNEDMLQQAPTEEQLEAIEVKQVRKEHAYYEARIVKLRDKLAEEKDKRNVKKDDPAVAYEKLVRGKQDYLDTKEHVAELTKQHEDLDNDLQNRQKLWKRLRRHLENTTTEKFDELLTLNKGYSGKVDFDHRGETLDLRVNKENAKATDVKNLSGGERSYTTMCLLLALGEKLETPFRILDEYDVFLDGPTRKLSTKMLVHLATEKMAHRQFIFITPQDLSWVECNPQVQKHTLKPPQRHELVGGLVQSTLDFSQRDDEE